MPMFSGRLVLNDLECAEEKHMQSSVQHHIDACSMLQAIYTPIA